METTTLSKTINTLPELIKNTHLNITLKGWPAAITFVAGFLSLSATFIYATKATQQKAASDQHEAA